MCGVAVTVTFAAGGATGAGCGFGAVFVATGGGTGGGVAGCWRHLATTAAPMPAKSSTTNAMLQIPLFFGGGAAAAGRDIVMTVGSATGRASVGAPAPARCAVSSV